MSKIGLTFQRGVIPLFARLIAKKPIAVLVVGNAVNTQIARDIVGTYPRCTILIRTGGDWAYKDDAWNQQYLDNALRIAEPFQREDLLDFLLPPNEPVITNDVEARQLNDRQVWYANQLKSHGYKTLAYKFSVGNPDYGLWPYLQDGIRACDGFLALNQYDVGPRRPDLYPDTSLRHRKVKPLIAPDIDLKIGITECLIDLGTDTSVYGHGGGYRTLPDNGHLIQDYLDHLSWYDNELAKDPYVKFANIFGCGMEEPWVSRGFDVLGVDTDADAFTNWLQSGVVDLTPTQTDGLCPFATWRPVANFGFPTGAHGRNGHPVKAVVLHIAAGNFDAIYPTFANGAASSHFAIAKDGRLEQYVNINDAAYGNGLSYASGIWYNPYGHVVQPTWPLIEAGVNPNLTTVSIEHDGQTGEPLTEPMNVTRTRLLVWLAQQYDWKSYASRINLIRHSQLDNVDRASCPGSAFNFDLIAQWANEILSPPTPDGDTMPTPEERKQHAWEDGLGIKYHPDYTFPQVAEKLKLGYPLPGKGEYRYVDAKGATIAGQAFAGAILEAPEGDFANTQAYDWNTGELYVAPSPTPTPTTPRLTVLPVAALEWKLKMDVYKPVAGQDFYGLIAISQPQVDNVPRFAFQVSDASGAQMPNAPCFHVFPDGNYECFSTSGSGYVEFLLGAGSKYEWTLGQSPKDKFYIGTEFRDRNKGEPFAPPKGDTYYFGLPDQRHLDATYSVRLMKG